MANGNQIRAARALLNWSQSRLADAAGLHVNSVKYWERNTAYKSRREERGLKAIRETLEGQGVAFVSGGAVLDKTAA